MVLYSRYAMFHLCRNKLKMKMETLLQILMKLQNLKDHVFKKLWLISICIRSIKTKSRKKLNRPVIFIVREIIFSNSQLKQAQDSMLGWEDNFPNTRGKFKTTPSQTIQQKKKVEDISKFILWKNKLTWYQGR